MTPPAVVRSIAQFWDDSIVPALVDYIRIPAKSPHFDPDWEKNGYIDAAVDHAAQWCRRNPIPGMKLEIVRLPGRTPVLLVEVPGERIGTVLVYGHLDKQPEMTGWHAGFGPWVPRIADGKLYGRGGADDGYAVFCAFAVLKHMREQHQPHARIVILIECCEESGSYDLPAYLDALAPRIGAPDLVVGLDSGCGNYEQLWGTASLRGLLNGTLTVEVLTEGVHSGDASGVVPSSFRIARALLDRIEDSATGVIKHPAFQAAIPAERSEQARAAAAVMSEEVWRKFPFVSGMRPAQPELESLVLNRTWRPALSVIGAEGLPPAPSAGNVLRPKTSLVLSLRLPPTVSAEGAGRSLKSVLEEHPLYGAKVSFDYEQAADGWNAPPTVPWLKAAVDRASAARFGKPAMWMGEGGTIPFMAMLGAKFPQAQFLVTGVLGPHSNAHGPNEFLHIEYAKRLTACVADVLAAHAESVTA
jgi:acetylornithine deacetylase/succinyl-diaminopimelate desuccinylase-like protein